MKSRSLLFAIIILGFCNCEQDTEPISEEIPLDGRGGGVIAYCYQPIDGSGLHQIYGINADGTGNKKLINATIGLNHHDWSPDGRKIVAVGYISGETWSIHVFNADGSNLTRLTSTNSVWDNEPNWSPDGIQIAFTRIFPNLNYREEIWIMNADGSNQHFTGIEGYAAKWSPDGNRLIFVSNRLGNYEIYISQLDGSNELQLTHTNIDESFPMWSSDGSQIAFSASTGTCNTPENIKTYEIYVMNADGSSVRRLTNNNSYDGYPRWSPDGILFAFSSDRTGYQLWEVFIMDISGANVRRVTHSPVGITAINPVWRPGISD